MKDINKDIDYFKQEFSIENIVLSLRKLKQQVKNMEVKIANDVPRPDNI